MEQKAVVYKNLKGMARDMAVSNGNNELSYENYNVRITTRGKEDSFVVTNEKGTESNIIATRSVYKTVNTIFQGKKPDFYSNFNSISSENRFNYKYIELYKKVDDYYVAVTEKEYATGKDNDNQDITFYVQTTNKSDVLLSSSNDEITFGYNTEYPVANENTDNALVIKGTFTLNETPTAFDNEDVYLIDNGEYTEERPFTILAGRNCDLATIKIKDIVLGGNAGYYQTDNSFDTINNSDFVNTYTQIVNPTQEDFDARTQDWYYIVTESNTDIYVVATEFVDGTDYYTYAKFPTDSVKANWMDSYRNLYDRLTERKFNFYGFKTNAYNYTTTEADSLQRLYQSINSGFAVDYPYGMYEQNEYYAGNVLTENNTTNAGVDTSDTTDYYRVSATVPGLSYLNGPLLADGYTYGSALTLVDEQNCRFRVRVIKTIPASFSDDSAKVYVYGKNASSLVDIEEAGTFGDIKNESNFRNKYYLSDGYFEITFDFSIKDYNPRGYVTKKPVSIIYNGTSGVYSNDLSCELSFGPYSGSSVFGISIKPKSQNWNYLAVDNNSNWFLKRTITDNSVTTDYIVQTLNVTYFHSSMIKYINDFDVSNPIPELKVGSLIYMACNIGQQTATTYNFGDIYKFDNFDGTQYKQTSTNQSNVEVKTYDGQIFTIGSGTTKYSCTNYKLLVNTCNKNAIESITSNKVNNREVIDIKLADTTSGNSTVTGHTLRYNPYPEEGTSELNAITDVTANNKYYMYQLVSDAFTQPFILYVRSVPQDDGFASGVDVYQFTSGEFSELSSFAALAKSDMSEVVQPCENPVSGNIKFYKENGVLKVGSAKSSGNNEFVGNCIISKLNSLPIYHNGETATTKIKSNFRQLFVYPTYNKVLEHYGFNQDKFKANYETNEKSFKLKYSNSDWDNKYSYQSLDSVNDNVDYIKEVYPLYYLDTTALNLIVEKKDNDCVGKFTIETETNDDSYFDSTLTINVTIKDKLDKNYSFTRTLTQFAEGQTDSTISSDLFSRHNFYIAEIIDSSIDKSKLEKADIDQEVTNNFISDEEENKYKDKIEYEILEATISDVKHTYVKQTYNPDGNEQVAIAEYNFSDTGTYKNKFFSVLNLSLLVSNYGDYHALTIPGRILGSCTIEEYVVLFFHYSSPALKYYEKIGDNEYIYVDDTTGINELYTRRKGEDNIYDKAAINGVLLKDDNNDYINGKNRDYIVRLKYIDARPDNKENEWVKVVSKIANVATQPTLLSEVTEKKPYYAAEILWSGDLGFNSNFGIETIGYYESKDVIKVYWTDGKNQPRMMNIMTPRSKRGYGDMNYTWDNKTFDFIQEISGSEKCKIVKQFGGGAFPAGSVQYYFTYSNQGGCETNPFYCSKIYYTSQSSKGDSPIKITDNTFKITLYNLSTRFDYVNIYSVVRSTQNAQPYCKKVISLSMKNNNKTITFTDNNLIGETVDHTYLLMLQGTPINALTFAEKDNTLFLGNINKLTYNMTPEEKEELKSCFIVSQKQRRYQNYNPNEEEWYENAVDEVYRNGNTEKRISLEKNSSEIKTFMYNEYYRLGIQLQDKFGKWTDPIFIEDIKCDLPIKNRIKYETSQEDGSKSVSNLQSYIPYFDLRLVNGADEKFKKIINKYEYKRIRPVIVYPNISSRNVLAQGLLNPTMFNYADRSVNGPFNFSSYYFRPYPPAISENKDDSGNYKFDIDVDVAKSGGYPIEYRHGYPITGWHDAVEEALAQGKAVGANGVAQLVNNYLSDKPTTFVKLTSNTPGWWIGGATYLREGTIEFSSTGIPTFKSGGKIYKVTESTNKGHLNYMYTLSEDKQFVKIENSSTSEAFTNSVLNMLGLTIISSAESGTGISQKNSYKNAIGFSSHMHYFKNKILNLASMFLTADVITTSYQLADMVATGTEIIKKISGPDFAFAGDSIVFNEGGVYYRAYYPLTIKILPLSEVRKQKHRGLKRKTYYCDITVTANRIELSSSTDGGKYIDDGGAQSEVAKKAYFAYNNGEIACANGNKNYNIFKGSNLVKIDDDYNSSEINVAGRKQSLFYVDESVCTLNSPEIEYNPTVQKIDLSNYKLNIVGAANITGYKNRIDIDYETPPAIFGSIVGQGFRHEPFEIQNFSTEAYRFMLSGAYWYDAFFREGDEGEAENYGNDSKYVSDQYCWWVYPFNRQILNNSHEGAYGKCRTKKWVNYHYSAFSDYFGKSSVEYKLDDAKQIYDEYQAVNLDTTWMKDKATYFGSCDTAYTNPVPLVGILGGSNSAEENAYEQSLAVSPHCGFKAGSDTYTSANVADIVPFTFASSNHFVLSLQGVENERKSNVFPKFFTTESVMRDSRKITSAIPFEERYNLAFYDYDLQSEDFYSTQNPISFFGVEKNDTMFMYSEDNTKGIILYKKMNVTNGRYYGIIILDENGDVTSYDYSWGTNVTPELIDENSTVTSSVSFDDTDTTLITSISFKKQIIPGQEYEGSYNDFDKDDTNNWYTLEKEYSIPASLINDSTKPNACVERYIQFNDIEKDNGVKETGIYDYGHVYIAQLERGVKSADEVFSGTEESILLQNTWLPAGEAIMINEFNTNGLKYTEGDTYYQRYDCLKTYAHSSSDVNQNMEYLSAMIQTRINLDGIYSVRGLVDNVDANDSNTNLLNQAYTQDDNYFSYTITDPYISDITEYSNMFTWTLTKQIMSSKDNWTAINLISFYNATGSFGKITRLINYRNDIFCFQNNAISKILYNERVALTPSDGVPIEIGNSGKVQGLGYISSNVGCQNRWSVVPSKGFLYWVDDRRAEIYRFGEGLEPFSTAKGFSDWVKANTYGEDWKPIKSTNVPITAYYDNNNDDIYFVTEKDCLAYNEKIDAFESFFSYEDSFILNSAGNTLVIKEQDTLITDNTDVYESQSVWDNGIKGDGLSSIELMHEGEYNRFFGVQMPFYVRFKVYPDNMQRDKIYTNLEFNIDAFDEKDIYLPDETFTRVRVWDEYQWGQMYLTVNPYGTTNYKRRFRNHYLQLPRASYYPVYNVYENYNNMYQRELVWMTIPSSGEMPIPFLSNSSSNDRIRNPWVWMEMYKENKDFIEDTSIINEQTYLANKNKLFLRRFVEVSSDDFNSYEKLFKPTFKTIDVTSLTFETLKPKLYIYDDTKIINNYVKLASDATYSGSTTYYEINKYEEVTDNNDRLATATIVNDRENYPLESLWYIAKNGEYEGKINGIGDVVKFSKAGQDHYDNDNVDLYNLQYNTLYKEEYIYCANNFNFASDAIYYKLKNSNCRVEIHDIIVKYFEA